MSDELHPRDSMEQIVRDIVSSELESRYEGTDQADKDLVREIVREELGGSYKSWLGVLARIEALEKQAIRSYSGGIANSAFVTTTWAPTQETQDAWTALHRRVEALEKANHLSDCLEDERAAMTELSGRVGDIAARATVDRNLSAQLAERIDNLERAMRYEAAKIKMVEAATPAPCAESFQRAVFSILEDGAMSYQEAHEAIEGISRHYGWKSKQVR